LVDTLTDSCIAQYRRLGEQQYITAQRRCTRWWNYPNWTRR